MKVIKVLDRVVAFQRVFVELTGSVTGALFLSQAVYWQNRSESDDGWWWKTQEDWESETGMTRREWESARAASSQFVKWERRGVPAKTFYLVSNDAIEASLELFSVQTSLAETAKLDSAKTPNCAGGNRQTTNGDYKKITSPKAVLAGFDEFWQAYPKKVGKAAAIKAWSKLKGVTLLELLNAVRCQAKTADWLKDGGQFVPHAATWLNGERWMDEIKSAALATSAEKPHDPNAYAYQTATEMKIGKLIFTKDRPPRREQFRNDKEGQGQFETYTSAWESWKAKVAK